ncbi:MAG: putative small lipoprotein YifL [Candidatus Azotimanducaceae bacterium]|jgi:predicted small lipoprotein YifL
MQRRVLIIWLGMVIASLASACGQKGPLFLPEATDDNTSVNAAHYANDDPRCEQVSVTHAGASSTGSIDTASPSTTRTLVSAHMHRPALSRKVRS